MISIGMISDDGRKSYSACLSDGWCPTACDAWMKKNVLPHLPPREDRKPRGRVAQEILLLVGPDPEDEREEELRMSWEYHRHDPPHRSSWRDAIGFIVGMVIIIGAISLAISFLDHFLGWLASPSRLSRPY